MKFAQLTRVAWAVPFYRSPIVWVNFDHVAGMSNASVSEGGGAYLKFLLQDTSTGGPTVGPNDGIFGPTSVVIGSNQSVLFIPVTRAVAEAGWSSTIYLNIAHGVTATRNAGDTLTRIRVAEAVQMVTPTAAQFPANLTNAMRGLADFEVLETPQQIADLASTAMKVVTIQVVETVEQILELLA